MAHYTRFIIAHRDGHTDSFVGNPQSTYAKALAEIQRLVTEEGFEQSELSIVEVPA